MSETENQKWECTKKYNYNNFDFLSICCSKMKFYTFWQWHSFYVWNLDTCLQGMHFSESKEF